MLTMRKQEEQRARAEMVKGGLEDWSDWTRGYKIRNGFPTRSAGFQSGGVVGDSTDSDNYAAADIARFQAIEACIDDLPPNQRAAIHHRYLYAVFRMRDYEGSLLAAHERLALTFRSKGVLW